MSAWPVTNQEWLRGVENSAESRGKAAGAAKLVREDASGGGVHVVRHHHSLGAEDLGALVVPVRGLVPYLQSTEPSVGSAPVGGAVRRLAAHVDDRVLAVCEANHDVGRVERLSSNE